MHKQFTIEDDESVEQNKEVCIPGYVYKNAFGDETVFSFNNNLVEDKLLVEKITEEVFKQFKKK